MYIYIYICLAPGGAKSHVRREGAANAPNYPYHSLPQI